MGTAKLHQRENCEGTNSFSASPLGQSGREHLWSHILFAFANELPHPCFMYFNCYGKSNSKDFEMSMFSGNFRLILCPAYFTGRGFSFSIFSLRFPRHCHPSHLQPKFSPGKKANPKWPAVTQSCPALCNPMDCSPPSSSVHGILQARILEWVAISFSRGSSWPRDQTQVSCIAGRRLTAWATRGSPKGHN